MKVLHRLLAFTTLALLATPLLPAQTITTLTCQTSGGTTLTIPAYAFTFEASGASTTRYFTVYTDLSRLNSLIIDLYFTPNYASCNFSGDSALTLSQITMVDVDSAGAAGGLQSPTGPQAYASVTFTSTFLNVNNAVATPANAKPMTPAEQAQALAAFKARGLALPK